MPEKYEELVKGGLLRKHEAEALRLAALPRTSRAASIALALRRVAEEAQPEGERLWTRLREVSRALEDLVSKVYGGSPAGLLTAYNAAKRVIARAEEPAPSELSAAREQVRRLREALLGLKYRPDPSEPGEPDRYCDHAVEPCIRCMTARAALAETGQEEGK